jgi:hypothetical protein
MVEVSNSSRPPWPWLIAFVLAVAGSFWGVLLLVTGGLAALAPLPFGVGYLVTVGYIIRAVSVPSLTTRRVIWGASILVQGGWFAYVALDAWPPAGADLCLLLWWALATAGSVVALVTEQDRYAGDQITDYDDASLAEKHNGRNPINRSDGPGDVTPSDSAP